MGKDFGGILRQLRREKKLTQQEVANRLGVTRATVSNYETNRRTPHLKDLQKLAEFYGAGLEIFGITHADETMDLLVRARDVFLSNAVSDATKEALYMEFMKLYLELKGDKK